MTLEQLKSEIKKYQYLENTQFIDAALSCIITTRLAVGNPLWLILIGPSSSGKTQILRPLALTDKDFIHQLDDITENTFLSGAIVGKGQKPMSLLNRIGSLGVLIISDLTGLFSKPADSRNNILGQMRMIYDGEMTKHVGTMTKPLHWEGRIQMLAGSTPSIYKHFEAVASFGERFLHFRLHEFNRIKATSTMMNRKGGKTDAELAELYGDYIREVVEYAKEKGVGGEDLGDIAEERIIDVASNVELLRVTGDFDWKSELLMRIPCPAMPMRTAGQLQTLAFGLRAMRMHDGLGGELRESDLEIIDWCGYSLVNDERRECLRVLASIPFGNSLSTAKIADRAGLPTNAVRMIMQVFTAVKIVERSGDDTGLSWSLKDENIYKMVRRIEKIDKDEVIEDRKATLEEREEIEEAANRALEDWGNLGG